MKNSRRTAAKKPREALSSTNTRVSRVAFGWDRSLASMTEQEEEGSVVKQDGTMSMHTSNEEPRMVEKQNENNSDEHSNISKNRKGVEAFCPEQRATGKNKERKRTKKYREY